MIGAFRVNGGTMESGVIVAFLQYFIMILNAMLTVTRIFVMLSKGEASANRVADVLETGEDLTVICHSEERSDEESPVYRYSGDPSPAAQDDISMVR